LPREWIDKMRLAVDRVISAPSGSAVEMAREGTGRYVSDYFVWMRDADFRDLVLHSPLPRLAAEIMGSTHARLFYDHLLVKEPESAAETPWHQDLPYWPVRGDHVLSLWVPLDPVTVESGAVQYVAGSHKLGKMYAPRSFSKDSGFDELYARMGLDPLPNAEQIRSSGEILVWSTEPGDVIVHHPLTFHYASGNASATERRRAIAIRYLGDEACYDARAGTFVEKESIRTGLFEPIDYRDGERLGGRNFPIAWPYCPLSAG
jgi:ectoine hydroxylase-related dioxygenase (phytanoyl-CoA dioxygenase family)